MNHGDSPQSSNLSNKKKPKSKSVQRTGRYDAKSDLFSDRCQCNVVSLTVDGMDHTLVAETSPDNQDVGLTTLQNLGEIVDESSPNT